MENLSNMLFVENQAVENWASFQLEKSFAGLGAAKASLLKQIDEFGEFSTNGPAWMTSVSPKVFAWIILPDNLCLALQKDEAKSSGREYLATNCKSKSKKKKIKPFQNEEKSVFPKELKEVEARKKVNVSFHAQQRLKLRAGLEWSEQEWIQKFKAAKLSLPPDWAKASRGTNWVFWWKENDDEWIVYLRQDQNGWTATTLLSKSWVLTDLQKLEQERETILFATKFVEANPNWQTIREKADIKLIFKGQTGPWLVFKTIALPLYPADRVQKGRGYNWVVR